MTPHSVLDRARLRIFAAMPSKPIDTIAYVFPQRFHFVAKDIEALRQVVMVAEHRFSSGPAWCLPWDYLRQLFFLLRQRARGVRHVYAHFAGHHTVLPTALGFRTYIIIAGSDACSFPGINYGSFRKPLMRKAMAYSMRRAVRLLPVHRSLSRFRNSFSDFGPIEQGYAQFVPGLHTLSTAIPYGFDFEDWPLSTAQRDPHAVLCVATGAAPGNAVHFRKGVDLLIATASLLPDHRFTIVGAAQPGAYQDLPTNMHMIGGCSPSDLRDLFSTHGIYAQPSVMEGFPNALCEAMLMGCLPVVSNITSMPDIVGSEGRVIEERDAAVLATAIRAQSGLSSEDRRTARNAVRERILKFTIHARVQGLLAELGADDRLGRIHNEADL